MDLNPQRVEFTRSRISPWWLRMGRTARTNDHHQTQQHREMSHCPCIHTNHIRHPHRSCRQMVRPMTALYRRSTISEGPTATGITDRPETSRPATDGGPIRASGAQVALLRRDRTCRTAATASSDEVGGKGDSDGIGRFVVDELEEQLGSCRSRRGGVLVDGGEGRVEVRGDGDVSEAHQRNVGGDVEAAAVRGLDDSNRELVAQCKDRGWGWVEIEELVGAFDSRLGTEVRDMCDLFGVEGERVVAKSLLDAGVGIVDAR